MDDVISSLLKYCFPLSTFSQIGSKRSIPQIFFWKEGATLASGGGGVDKNLSASTGVEESVDGEK